MISYLWPLLMIALLGIHGIARTTRLQVLGTGLGFIGLACVVLPESASGGPIGYRLTLLAALCFATYSALRMQMAEGRSDAVGAVCGAAAIVAVSIHLILDGGAPLPFDRSAILAMVPIGIGPMAMGLANRVWDQGVRFGDSRILTALAYLTPALSTLLLVASGLAALTPPILLGGSLIPAGIALSTLGAGCE